MPNRRELELPGISLAAAVVQFLLNILFFPAIRTLSPGELFQPELAPSGRVTATLTAVAVLSGAAAFAAWRNRLAARTPPEQAREAEQAHA